MGITGKTYTITTDLKGATEAAQKADVLNKSIVNLGTGIVKTGNSTAAATQQFTKLGQSQTALTAPMRAVNTELATQTATLPKTVTNTTQLTGALGGVKKSYDTVRGPQELYNKNLGVMEKTQTTMGSKIKSFGSNMGGLSTNMATLGGTILNTSRQYQDLADAQIKVDRTTLKLSKANENVTATQAKMNEAIAKYGPNSKQAEAATLNYNQALDQQKLATTMLGEAQEDQQRTFENFWMGIIPTVTSSAGTIMSSLQAIGGEKGISGLLSKLKGLGSGITSSVIPALSNLTGSKGLGGLTEKLTAAGSSAGGLKGNLLGLSVTGAVIGGIAFGALELAKAMNIVASEFSNIEKPVSVLETGIDKTGKSLNTFNTVLDETEVKARVGIAPIHEAMDAIFGTHMTENILRNAGALDKNGKIILDYSKTAKTIPPITEEISASMDTAATSTDAWVNALIRAGDDPIKLAEFNKMFQDSGQSVERYQQIVLEADKIQNTYTASLEKTTKPLKLVGQSSGEVDDALKKLGPNITTVEKNTGDLNSALIAGYEAMQKADPIVQGFGDTAANMAKKLKLPTSATSNLTAETLNYRQAFTDTFVNNPTAITKTAKYYADLEKAAKDLAEEQKNLQEQTRQETETYVQLSDKLKGVLTLRNATTDDLITYNKIIDNARSNLESENKALFDQAMALGLNIDKHKDLAVVTGKSDETIKANNKTLKEQILVLSQDTSFLTDNTKRMEMFTDARIQGVQSANDWIQSLIKSTAAGKAEDIQILKIATDLLGKGHPALQMASDDLKIYIENLVDTEGALKKVGDAVKTQLGKAFSIIDVDTLKEAKENIKKFLKEMDLPKGLEKKIDIELRGKFKAKEAIDKAQQDLLGLSLLVNANINEKEFDKGIKKVIGNLKDSLAKGADVQPMIDLLENIKGSESSADAFALAMEKITGINAQDILTDPQKFLETLKSMTPEQINSLADVALGIDATGTAASGTAEPLNQFQQQIVDIQDLNKVMNTHYIEGLNAMGNKTEQFRNVAGSRMAAVKTQLTNNLQDINKVMNTHYIGGLNVGGDKTEQFKKVATSNMAQTKSGMVGDIVEINKKLNTHFIAGLNAGGNVSGKFRDVVTKNFNAVGNSARNLISDISELADELADLDGTKSVVTIEHRTVNTTVNQRYGGSHIYDPGYQMGGAFISYQDQYYKGAHISEYNKPELVTVTPLTNPNILDDKEIHIKTENQGLNFERMTQRIVNALKENSVFGHINANLFVNGQQVYNAMRPFQLRRLTTQL